MVYKISPNKTSFIIVLKKFRAHKPSKASLVKSLSHNVSEYRNFDNLNAALGKFSNNSNIFPKKITNIL